MGSSGEDQASERTGDTHTHPPPQVWRDAALPSCVVFEQGQVFRTFARDVVAGKESKPRQQLLHDGRCFDRNELPGEKAPIFPLQQGKLSARKGKGARSDLCGAPRSKKSLFLLLLVLVRQGGKKPEFDGPGDQLQLPRTSPSRPAVTPAPSSFPLRSGGRVAQAQGLARCYSLDHVVGVRTRAAGTVTAERAVDVGGEVVGEVRDFEAAF